MPTPATPDLRVAFALPPARAVEYFRAKGYAITRDWSDLWQDAHARAFTVAHVSRLDILQDIHGELERALAGKITEREFARNLRPRLEALGWWGKQVQVDEATGEAQLVQTGSPWRLRTIYRTNLQSAYLAGRYRQMMDNVADRPYWQYVAVMDERTRPAHAAMNGLVFPYDDPFWEHFFPPNGFNCRCTVRARSEADIKAAGLRVLDSGKYLREMWATDASTGLTERVALYKGPGMRIAARTDLGWNYNPGAAGLEHLAELAMQRVAVAPAALGATAFAAMAPVIAAPLEADFVAWVDRALAGRVAGHDWRIVGAAAPEDIAWLAERGQQVASAEIGVEARLIVGPKAARHATAGDALEAGDWKALPAGIAAPRAVLYDTETGNLLYVYPAAEDPRLARIVVRPNMLLKKSPGELNAVRSAAKVSLDSLEGRVKGGRYEVVRGAL